MSRPALEQWPARPLHHPPRDAEERYAYRVRGGIGLCGLCGAVVGICAYSSARPPVTSWHMPGMSLFDPVWERVWVELPRPCRGQLLALPPEVSE